MLQSFNVSILTKIEFLGWDKHTNEGFKKCANLVNFANIYELNSQIAERTIDLKRNKKIKIADAIIAATALVNNFTIVTRNVNDFKGIVGLDVFNPF